MLTPQLLHPNSIVVVGGSNDVRKPGGKVLKNIIDGGFAGALSVINPKEDEVQGIRAYPDAAALPQADLAVIAIAAKYTLPVIETLAREKGTRGFIILSAGFSEESAAGKELERQVVEVIDSVGGSLIGPNCTGICTPHHHSIFTEPIPTLDPKGVDFISGSGATACFILEAGIPKGLTFASIFAVGNSAQLGVEEVLAHLDESFDPASSSRVKLLYIETIAKPDKLLRHARSLIRKGCRIAAVKAGSSEAGSRAASSHTGALASSDVAVDALFRKAGIVRCYGREDLITVASVFMHPPLRGKNIAIITHAGGPAVMLTDALSNGGLAVPHLSGPAADNLLTKLHPGSSVANPIDFLATGTAEQLGAIIDAVDTQFDDIDAMVVIFGTPGLAKIFDVYDLLHEKMQTAKKPIYPVLPSTLTAREEVEAFLDKGRINFPDEVNLGNALARIFHTPPPATDNVLPATDTDQPAVDTDQPAVDNAAIRTVIDAQADGYIAPDAIQRLLDAAGIPRAGEAVVSTVDDAVWEAKRLGFPVVMKVVGPVHKSDVGGVVLGIKDEETVRAEFTRMMGIPDTTAVLLQPMLRGLELFAGVKKEGAFGHLVLCGLGGIFIEVLKDVRAGLAPLSRDEALGMIRGLKGYRILQGVRGQAGVSEEALADVVVRLSALVQAAPEIVEMDLNPLLGSPEGVTAVDARIRLER
ncbi:MAG: acetate--CoA ligase family protein [Bacteroidetes bacterium]|nr:acetate--CoA ligase family protein [Bacteroidota bacterium]